MAFRMVAAVDVKEKTGTVAESESCDGGRERVGFVHEDVVEGYEKTGTLAERGSCDTGRGREVGMFKLTSMVALYESGFLERQSTGGELLVLFRLAKTEEADEVSGGGEVKTLVVVRGTTFVRGLTSDGRAFATGKSEGGIVRGDGAVVKFCEGNAVREVEDRDW